MRTENCEQMGQGSRHAYLIMAHKDDLTLHTLLRLLDDSRNDIYIHMDAKTADWDESRARRELSASALVAIRRKNCVWGGYSQIDIELDLIEAAIKSGHYTYYHLLSGEDLPIKTQDVAHDFFDRHDGTEFVRYASEPCDCLGRLVGHFLWNRFARNRNAKVLCRLDDWFSRITLALSKPESLPELKKGDNWFSITDEFAHYIVSRRDWIWFTFRNSICCDEVFLQTLLWNSQFKDRAYRQLGDDGSEAIMRLIDWKRGQPYCFRIDDLHELEASDFLFARKFDCEKDAEIIKAVEKMVEAVAALDEGGMQAPSRI